MSLISIAIALSLAEICFIYPTAGGVYYWAALLSKRKWAPAASWVTGWLTLAGNWTLALSINFGGAQLILSCISLWNEDFVATDWQTVLCFWCVCLVCYLVNIVGAKHLDLINTICVYWTGASIVVILVVILVMAPARNSGAYVFGHYDSSQSGYPTGWSFFIGLQQAAFTLTGYGMIAVMCEEVQHPEREVPKAMVWSVVGAGITGLVYLIPILFVLPDVKELLSVASGQPLGLLFKHATGSAGGGFGLLFLVLGIWLFAGIGALTASSRCLYSFARDGAVPWSRIWSKIDTHFNVPLMALTLSTVVACLLGLIYFGSSAALFSFTGVATICLSASYALPVLVSLLTGREKVREAPFSLGYWGWVVNGVTVAWIVLAVFILSMPITLIDLAPTTMNYASVVFAGFALISVAWYFAYGLKHFHGPPILLTDVPNFAIGIHKNGQYDLEKVESQDKPDIEVSNFRLDTWNE